MPIYDRCKKCRTLKPQDELGSNGVCIGCMEHVLETLPEKPATAPATAPATKAEITEKPRAKFQLEKDGEKKSFASAKEVGAFLGVHFNKVHHMVKKSEPVDGWSFI